MSAQNNDFLYDQLGNQGFAAGEEIYLFAGAPTSQQAAYPIKSQLHRVILNAVANASLVLKSILSNDNPGMVFIINDGANSVVVFPFKAFGGGATDTAETINGGASFSITAGNAAVLIASTPQTRRKGGVGSSAPPLNWQAALLS